MSKTLLSGGCYTTRDCEESRQLVHVNLVGNHGAHSEIVVMPDEVSLSMLMTAAWCVSNWTEVSLLFWKQALTTSYVVVTDSVELLNLVGSCQLHSPWHCQPLIWQFESKDKHHGLFLRARWSCVSDWQLWPTRLCDNSSDDKLPADWMSLMPARCQNLILSD